MKKRRTLFKNTLREKFHSNPVVQSIPKDSGITLLALIVTIIIMLILAGVSLSGMIGDDGIISKAITATHGWETSEEKEVLAVAYSALLLDQELYDEEITDESMQKEIIHNGKEADVRIHEDYKNILVIKFKKTGNVYWIRLEDGRVEYKGQNTGKYDDKELNEGDIIFESLPTKWTNEEVKTTIKVKQGVNMKNLQLQWTKTPNNSNSWKEYTSETEIISEKNETIYARIRETLTDYTKLQASTKIDNIDQLNPEGEIEVETTTNRARVTINANDKSATTEYGNSGIKGYYYRKDETSDWSEITTATSYQFTNLIQTTEYNFQVKIEDNAGNTTVVSSKENTETVPTPTNADLKYATNWDGTDVTVTFTTTKGFTIETSIDGTNWTEENPLTVTSGTQIYVRYSDGTNEGMRYAAVKPLWTGTVSYNPNGGTGGPSARSAEHTTTVAVNFSSLPTRTGYTFQGWNTKADGTGTSYASNGTTTFTMGTSDVTLYAQWKVNNYTVTYNYSTNGGTSATKTTETVAYGSVIDLSPTATKSGYTFVGWNTSSSATTKLTSLTMGTSNVTLYAIYSKTISAKWYYYNGSSYTNSTTTVTIYNTTTSGTPSKPQASNPSGWTARGWSTSNAANATTATPGAISSDTTYYYSWSKTVTISYNANSGSGVPSAQTGTAYLNYAGVASSARITISTTKPTRTGYTFQGWDTSSTATSATYTSGNPFSFSSSATLYAVWKANTYTITYDVLGGTGGPSTQTIVYGQTNNVSTTTPTKSGYVFAGWSTTTQGSAPYIQVAYKAGASIAATQNYALKAVWAKIEITANNQTYYSNSITTGIGGAQHYISGAITCKILVSETISSCTISSGKNVTINLNSKTITFASTGFVNNGTLTINGAGGIYSTVATSSDNSPIMNYGTLTVNAGVTISSPNKAAICTYNDLVSNPSTTINGATLTCTNDGAMWNAGTTTIKSGSRITGSYAVGIKDGGTLYIDGGELTGNSNHTIYTGAGSDGTKPRDIFMSGGTLRNNSQDSNHSTVALQINGDYFRMTGGTIYSNGNRGWAVWIGSGAKFLLYGGTVQAGFGGLTVGDVSGNGYTKNGGSEKDMYGNEVN